MSRKNEALLGAALPNWKTALSPFDANFGENLQGNHVAVVPLNIARHSEGLFACFSEDTTEAIWDYIDGPFANASAYANWLRKKTEPREALFFVVQDLKSKRYVGIASYLRICPGEGTIEVGNICFSPALQATIGATEAIYLLMAWVFSAGYRRLEWKCNALNLKSRRAAQCICHRANSLKLVPVVCPLCCIHSPIQHRLGFSYEGVFRQHRVQNGFNRDTAWFAMIDAEWPAVQRALTAWLAPDNFDVHGQQRSSLSADTARLLFAKDPVCAVEAMNLNPFSRSTCGIQ